MKHNTGGIDRSIRIVLGMTAIGAGIYFHSYWGAVGLIPLITGLIGWCPAYLPFGMSTCRIDAKK